MNEGWKRRFPHGWTGRSRLHLKFRRQHYVNGFHIFIFLEINIPVEQIEAKFSFEKFKMSALEFVVRSLKTGKNNRQIEFQIILQYSTKTPGILSGQCFKLLSKKQSLRYYYKIRVLHFRYFIATEGDPMKRHLNR